MVNKIKTISTINKLIIVSLLLLAVTNPYSVGYISYGLDWLSINITRFSLYAFGVSMVFTVLTMLYVMYATKEIVKIPKGKSTRVK